MNKSSLIVLALATRGNVARSLKQGEQTRHLRAGSQPRPGYFCRFPLPFFYCRSRQPAHAELSFAFLLCDTEILRSSGELLWVELHLKQGVVAAAHWIQWQNLPQASVRPGFHLEPVCEPTTKPPCSPFPSEPLPNTIFWRRGTASWVCCQEICIGHPTCFLRDL